MNVTAIIKNVKQANDIKDLVSAFIVPIDDYSINYEYTLSIDDILDIKKLGKQIFVVVNKNIHNNELDSLGKILMKLSEIKIDGIIFYDIAIVNLRNKLSLNVPLVWAQEHLTTNYKTINYWYDKGCEYAYLSSELMKSEMDDILSLSFSKLFVNVFGYLPMFSSKRHIVNNYLEYFNIKDDNGRKTIYKEEKIYPITDTKNGTVVYSDYVLNALDEDFSGYDYIVFNCNFIDDDDFYDTLLKFKKGQNDYKFSFNHGFLYRKTIYKVKKDA